MGRATRWHRGLFGGKREDPSGQTTAGTRPAKEKRRWGFGVPSREQRRGEPAVEVAEERKRSYRQAQRPFVAAEDEEEQNKCAIAVAAATAAVAEAAVAAAQAAAAVVRLTSSGRSTVVFAPAAASKREEWAAIKIQATFRGYLARRALKALKGLVKLQALVRGNIVRKQAAETLRCMQALVRVQARARACRVLRSERSRFEKARCSHARASSRPATADASVRDRANSGGWNWLDRWIEERHWDGRGSSVKKTGNGAHLNDEKNAKILEVDPGKPQSHHLKRRTGHSQYHSSCSTLTSDKNSLSFVTLPDSPSTESTAAQQFAPSQSYSSVEAQQSLGHLRLPFESVELGDSPYYASSRPGSSRRGAFTPSKSECSRSIFSGYADCPNYMANTESSRAKLRSHSAPKQRPDRLNPSGPSAHQPSGHHLCMPRPPTRLTQALAGWIDLGCPSRADASK